MTPPSGPARWLRGEVRSLAKTRILEVQGVHYRHPRREAGREFNVIHAPDWVNVVALTPDDRLVLVRQFRFGVDALSLEVPGGVIDAGESPLAAGMRELREETGFTGDAPVLLGSVHPNPAIQDNRCHLVLITNARRTAELDWDPDEELEVLVQPVEEVYALAAAGGITHALVLNALLLFRPHWERRRKPGAV